MPGGEVEGREGGLGLEALKAQPACGFGLFRGKSREEDKVYAQPQFQAKSKDPLGN